MLTSIKLNADKAKTALIAAELAKCSPAERKIWLKLLLISELPPPSGRPLMEKLVAAECGLPESELKGMVAKAGHGSFVVEQVWPKAVGQPKPLDIAEVMGLYQNGGIEKHMGRMNGKEVAWLWRLVDRRLAIRLSAKSVLNAVHSDAYEGIPFSFATIFIAISSYAHRRSISCCSHRLLISFRRIDLG